MGKGKQLTWLDAYKEKQKKGVGVFCVNPTGTTTKEELRLILQTMKSKHGECQIYAEDNTSEYDLSLITLKWGQTLSDIDKKILEKAQLTGNPIIVKAAEDQFFTYGNQYDFSKKTGKWDFVEAKGEDLNQLPFEENPTLFKRRQNEFSPGLSQTLEQAHTPYFKQWIDENSDSFAKYGIVVQEIHALQKQPLWNVFKEAYLNYRSANEALVRPKLEADKKKVLAKHPGWADTVEEHIIQTALYWAFLFITNKTKEPDTATFIWYDGKATDTGNDALQFAQNSTKQTNCPWNMENAKHFPYELADLRKYKIELDKITQQETAMPAQLIEQIPQQQIKEQPQIKEFEFQKDSDLHPEVKGLLRETLIFLALRGDKDSIIRAADLCVALDESLKQRRGDSPPRRGDSPPRMDDSSTVIIRGLQSRQEEMKTYTPPASYSPKATSSFSNSTKAKPELPEVTIYATTFNGRQPQSCGREELAQVTPGTLVSTSPRPFGQNSSL